MNCTRRWRALSLTAERVGCRRTCTRQSGVARTRSAFQALGGSGMPNPRYRYRLMYVAAWNTVMVAPISTAKWWAVKLA